ncbi:hypothetical protein C1H46_010937 [Malus baccata]|uniref:Sey1/RHD3-like three-helix bundle domain-containing protein n=1 Tax=Malus baccata TaxID=106549 RepID=A0A540MXE9_MALBA|nr:hypothetical protein C1H46_010937 [Malus baccata]
MAMLGFDDYIEPLRFTWLGDLSAPVVITVCDFALPDGRSLLEARETSSALGAVGSADGSALAKALQEAVETGPVQGFGKRLSSILATYLSEKYDMEAIYFDERVRNSKRQLLESKALDFVYPAYSAMLGHLRYNALEDFQVRLEQLLNKGEGFASSVRTFAQSSMLEFEKGCADVAIQQANWDASKVREKLRRDIDAHASSVRSAKLAELNSNYERFNAWNEDIRNITKDARTVSLKLLLTMAAIRLDEKPDNIENVLVSSLVDGTVTAKEAHKRSNNWLPPPWAIMAMIVLGFNEFMMLLKPYGYRWTLRDSSSMALFLITVMNLIRKLAEEAQGNQTPEAQRRPVSLSSQSYRSETPQPNPVTSSFQESSVSSNISS